MQLLISHPADDRKAEETGWGYSQLSAETSACFGCSAASYGHLFGFAANSLISCLMSLTTSATVEEPSQDAVSSVVGCVSVTTDRQITADKTANQLHLLDMLTISLCDEGLQLSHDNRLK